MITSEKKQATIASVQTHKTDTGSAAAQAAILTARIAELSKHLETKKKDHAARRGLLQMVGQRKRMLKYLAETDSEQYLAVIDKLKLRK